MGDGAHERERLLDLLRSQHHFPGPYQVRVVVRPENRQPILDVVSATVGADNVLHVGERPSRHGSYVALRIRLQVPDPDAVLAVYDAVRGIEGVFAVM